MNAYIIIGHGNESILPNMRNKVPENCLLVTSEECGRFGTLPEHVFDAAQNPAFEEWFKDPVRYKRELESAFRKKLHMYLPGQEHPTLKYTLIDETKGLGVGVAGVWPLPSPPMVLSPGLPGIQKYYTTARDVSTAYSGSVWPRVAKRTTIESLRKMDLRVSQAKLFSEMPGIYFSFVCRNVIGYERNVRDYVDLPADTLMFNLPGSVRNLPKNVHIPPNLQRVTNRIHEMRNANRTSEERARATEYAAWERLMREMTVHRLDDASFLVRAIPDSQLETIDNLGRTLLNVATNEKLVFVARELLARGANPNNATYLMNTPLLDSVTFSEELTHELLAAGATPTVAINGSGVLHIVSVPHLVQTLVEAGADPDLQNLNGHTAFHLVSEETSFLYQELVDVGADAHIRNNMGLTPFLNSVLNGDLELAIQFAGIVELDAKELEEALNIAILHHHDDIAEWLVRDKLSATVAPGILRRARRHSLPRLTRLTRRILASKNRKTNRKTKRNMMGV